MTNRADILTKLKASNFKAAVARGANTTPQHRGRQEQSPSPLKAIQTSYKGYRFRSRLEARWAVYFDMIGWNWLYEHEGFDLGEGDLYLPDFFLPECGLYVEIKACMPDVDELRKAKKLALSSSRGVVFGIGLPDPEKLSSGLDGFTGQDDGTGKVGGYRKDVAALNKYCFIKWGRAGWFLYGDPSPDDFAACNAARSARFEHGEIP